VFGNIYFESVEHILSDTYLPGIAEL